jgi:hypothetical protein
VVHSQRASVYAGFEVDVQSFGGWFEQVAVAVEGFGQVVCVGCYACVCEDMVDFAGVEGFGVFEEGQEVGPGGYVGAVVG